MADVLATIAIVLIMLVAVGIAVGGGPHESKAQRAERHTEAQGCFYVGVLVVFLLLSFPAWRQGLIRLGVSQAWSWPVAVVGMIVLAVVLIGSMFGAHEAESRRGKLVGWVLLLAALTGWIFVLVGLHNMPDVLFHWVINVLGKL
ncbi:hypothetical protein GCM10009682_01610 [Luedemannella flava]|uniref:Tripartite tricarboxylate transporter TctB family protein n=1 Tax=Luedemannella flava TaxID=349316 RepID=A0ABP4XHH4_9ACTN